jgi:spectinomycin phosphotransferase/16S rRNA (guanine(1405)-N(7))-methyltransferase
VLTAPQDLPEDVIAALLARDWGLGVASLEYHPIGWGSHHWEVVDDTRTRWFATVDELEVKRYTADEPLEAAYARLRAALATARALADFGYDFVVAPIPTVDDEPLARLAGKFALALYPFVAGQSFAWGEFSTPGHLRAVLDIVVAIHTAPPQVRQFAETDDFTIPHRDELQAALDGDFGDRGPYARPTAGLLAAYAPAIRRSLIRYDELVAGVDSTRAVLTHGEPHPGNTMLAPDGWRLIDWDTVLVAPPERDMWSLDPATYATYQAATGVKLLPEVAELYRVRWELADIAVDVSRFRRPHAGDIDDDKAWELLRANVSAFGQGPAVPDILS